MDVITQFELADNILLSYKDDIAHDYDGYRNHVTRMLNFCHYLLPEISSEDSEKIQIAAAFHDIALWTHDRVDYLVPSYEDCSHWLEQNSRSNWKDELQVIIDMHHLLAEYKGPHARLAEVFRKADLVDFSLGVIKNDISLSFIKQVKRAIPKAGFHKALLRFTMIQLSRNPLIPLPMIRIKNIYKE